MVQLRKHAQPLSPAAGAKKPGRWSMGTRPTERKRSSMKSSTTSCGNSERRGTNEPPAVPRMAASGFFAKAAGPRTLLVHEKLSPRQEEFSARLSARRSE